MLVLLKKMIKMLGENEIPERIQEGISLNVELQNVSIVKKPRRIK